MKCVKEGVAVALKDVLSNVSDGYEEGKPSCVLWIGGRGRQEG